MSKLSKNSFFYSSLLAVVILGLIISSYVFGWTTPSANPPSSNLPAPINVGSDPQTKAGNLIIEGVLRLGQFTTANAPSGTEGALYYDTTENTTKLFSNAAWNDLGGGWDGILPNYTTTQRNDLSLTDGLIVYNTTENAMQIYASEVWRNVGGKLSSGIVCSLDGDCDSTHCIDGVCCATTCDGDCNRCNVAGSEGICTDTNLDCTGNCDVCSSGNCIASAGLCTGNCDTCSGSGTVYNCASDVALCTGNCDTCSGSGTVYNCSANVALCTGNCDICTGSGTAYNCAASNSLCSNTTSSCNCSGSGTAFNCQSCPDAYGTCGAPTCSSYVCGNNTASYNGDQCATCKQCSSGSCVSVANGTSGYGCTATHYRCDGNGNCTAPTTTSACLNIGGLKVASSYCTDANYDGCITGYEGADPCRSPVSCPTASRGAECWNYLYD